MGTDSCDDQALSSYGAQYIFSKNLEKYCKNGSKKEMKEMGEMGQDSFSRIISKEAQEALLMDSL